MQKILSPMDLFPIFAKTNVATGAVGRASELCAEEVSTREHNNSM